MKNLFIIITSGRTGSTYIRLWLNSFLDIRCHGEILRGNSKDGIRMFLNQNLTIKLFRRFFGDHKTTFKYNPVSKYFVKSYFNSLLNNPNHSAPWHTMEHWNDYLAQDSYDIGANNVGFKIIFDSYQYYYYKKHLEFNFKYLNPKIILLKRKNLLELLISFKLANNSGIFHSEKDINGGYAGALYLPTENIVNELDHLEELYVNMNSEFKEYQIFNLYYEDFFYSENSIDYQNKLREFIGSKSIKQKNPPKLKKLTKASVEEILINYNDIESILKKSKYSYCLT